MNSGIRFLSGSNYRIRQIEQKLTAAGTVAEFHGIPCIWLYKTKGTTNRPNAGQRYTNYFNLYGFKKKTYANDKLMWKCNNVTIC